MGNEYSDIGNAFAETSCKLLKEYTERLLAIKSEMTKLLEGFHASVDRRLDPLYVHERFNTERMAFEEHYPTFEKLIRQSSQWVEHGKPPKPHLQLELEVRLSDFETLIRSMRQFFRSQRI